MRNTRTRTTQATPRQAHETCPSPTEGGPSCPSPTEDRFSNRPLGHAAGGYARASLCFGDLAVAGVARSGNRATAGVLLRRESWVNPHFRLFAPSSMLPSRWRSTALVSCLPWSTTSRATCPSRMRGFTSTISAGTGCARRSRERDRPLLLYGILLRMVEMPALGRGTSP